MKASNCSLTRRTIRYSITVLEKKTNETQCFSRPRNTNGIHERKPLLHVFFLIFLRHGYVRSSRLELNSDELTKTILSRSERFVNDISNIILPVQHHNETPSHQDNEKRERAYKIHDIPRCNSASTLSKSPRVIFFFSIIL